MERPLYAFVFPVHAISKDNFKGRGSHGRPFLAKKFKDFERDLVKSYRQQVASDFQRFDTEDLEVDLKYFFKDKRHCDASNLPKSTLDAFNKVIWNDDKQIKRLRIDLDYDPNERIEMFVMTLIR